MRSNLQSSGAAGGAITQPSQEFLSSRHLVIVVYGFVGFSKQESIIVGGEVMRMPKDERWMSLTEKAKQT